MIFIEQAIPCVLHMENRVGEKMLKVLLQVGYNEQDSDPKWQEQMITNVTNKVNTKMLGTH